VNAAHVPVQHPAPDADCEVLEEAKDLAEAVNLLDSELPACEGDQGSTDEGPGEGTDQPPASPPDKKGSGKDKGG